MVAPLLGTPVAGPIKYFRGTNPADPTQEYSLTITDYTLPSGSYTASCTGTHYDGVSLASLCQPPSGGFLGAKLDDYGQCVTTSGQPQNVYGSLSCFLSAGIPSGSYLQSCVMPMMVGSKLTARCRLQDGRWRDNTVNDNFFPSACVFDIVNVNGLLECVGVR
jgi:hypothetical protein